MRSIFGTSNGAPKALVGFERSGIVRSALQRSGFQAISCDIAQAEDGGNHYRGDIMRPLLHLASEYDDSLMAYEVIAEESQEWHNHPWDLIILHPPCRCLAVSGNAHYGKGKPRHDERLKAIEYTMKIWELACDESFAVCMENPVGVLPIKPTQYIQPYEYGEDASKKTGLWLKNLPDLKPTHRRPGRMVNGKERWANQCDSGQNKLGPSPDRPRQRSQTYRSIAQAMAEQWTNYFIEEGRYHKD